MSPTFLFFGYGSEYSLDPLKTYMEKCGDRCIEIEMLDCGTTINSLRDLSSDVVFVTSGHLLYDWHNFSFYRTERDIVSPLHVMSTLEPVASIYYPHDYKDPIKEEEGSYLALFDLVLWPYVTDLPEAASALAVVGWIKCVADTLDVARLPANPSGRVLFPGALQHYLNEEPDKLYADFRELFETGVAVKLARWHDTERLEDSLRKRGVLVYPSTSNSIEVMDANQIILTQALSSVAMEACHLGKSVIYLQDARFDYRDPRAEFKNAGALVYADTPATAAYLMDRPLPANSRTMMAFEFDRARDEIWAIYKAKTVR